jgi:hypothetical protein
MKYVRTAGYIWTNNKKNKYRDCKGIKYKPVLDKIRDYKRNWIQHVNRMPRNITHTDKKGQRKTIEETSGCVRPERVNEWPNP